MTVQVEGARRLRSTLRKAGDDLGDLKAAHAAAAGIVTTAARGRAPRRTGRLAADVRGTGTKTAGIVRAGRASVPYANPIHWGWPRRGIPAQPFVTEAAQSTEGTWVEVYEAAVNRILSRVKGK